jgi:hypothetical protein
VVVHVGIPPRIEEPLLHGNDRWLASGNQITQQSSFRGSVPPIGLIGGAGVLVGVYGSTNMGWVPTVSPVTIIGGGSSPSSA